MTTQYEQIGGEIAVRQLVDDFYDAMDSAPGAKDVRALHAASLKSSRDKLFLFLTGWLGGPPLYTDRYGHPMLRARHLPFAIAERERDQWLWCMEQAFAKHAMPDDLKVFLCGRFNQLADHMRNR